MLYTVFESCDFFTPEVKIRPGIRYHIRRNRRFCLTNGKEHHDHHSQPHKSGRQPERTVPVDHQKPDTANHHKNQNQCRKKKHKKHRQPLINLTICFIAAQSPSVFKGLKIFRSLCIAAYLCSRFDDNFAEGWFLSCIACIP